MCAGPRDRLVGPYVDGDRGVGVDVPRLKCEQETLDDLGSILREIPGFAEVAREVVQLDPRPIVKVEELPFAAPE